MTPFEDSIALIGAGQMGQALARGFCNSGECDPASIIAFDPSLAAEKNLQNSIPGVRLTKTASEATRAARFVILAVKPQHAASVCKDIQPALQDGTIVISIIAGLPIWGPMDASAFCDCNIVCAISSHDMNLQKVLFLSVSAISNPLSIR